ncbi:Hemicentin-1 [Mizuhopecten yessoensis]|uniref:Hemicentin-1 n=1 Tax=Mizuhopecten yessoensis TaxID=6573 RepID=A0A210PG54_MIZYE|nr:Hemicentin-1 [Mizuhopecten yessoensis]
MSANPNAQTVHWTFTPIGGTETTLSIDNTNYQGSTTSNPSLTVINANSADAGSYVCHATNSAGIGNSATITLTVGTIPVLSVQQTAKTVVPGSNAILQCSITSANPNAQTVHWTFTPIGGTETTLSIDNTNYQGSTTSNPSLTVVNANSADAGSYVCHATNSAGIGNSATITLTVGSLPTVVIQQNTYSASTGSSLTLVCTVSANPAHTSVGWEKLVNNVYQTVSISGNTRYTGGSTTTPSLAITNSQPSDSGTYRCTATNPVGIGTSGTTQLTVSGSLPTVVIQQNTYSATTGSSLTLVCTVSANPAHTSVGWEKLVNNVYQTVSISGNTRYTGGSTTTPSLAITNSQPSDSGTYRCTATNPVGIGTSGTTQLTVSGNVPLVSIQLTTYSAVIGDPVTIPCSITSDPAHTAVSWQRTVNGQVTTVTTSSSGGKYTVGPLTSPALTITGIQSSDQGVYICIAVNSVGSGQDSTTLSVTGGTPVVTIPLSGYSVQTGSSITIPCIIVATPSITGVTWRSVQGTQSIPLTINGQTYSGGSTATPALTIPSAVRTTHEGFYVCTATNAAGVGTSGTIRLSVTGAIPTVTVQQTAATAIIGTSVTLQCQINADPVVTIVEWTKVGSTTAITTSGNSKYTGGTPSNPSLTIATTDNNDAGGYICSATNAVGKGTSGQVTLTVSGNSPTVTVTQTLYTVITGSSAIIQCSAAGVPAVTSVYWEKVASNGQTTQLTLSSGRFTVSNPSLNIANAANGDAGTYRCVAVNIVGTTQSNQVMVTITGAIPTVVIGAATYTAVTGTQVTLGCTVTASPTASLIRWSKTTTSGSTVITVDGTKYQDAVSANPSLVINMVSQSDEGTYVCRATNVVGTGTSGQTVLSVTGSIPNVQVTQASYSVTKGGTITLECTVSGVPAATSVSWKRTSGGTETTVSTSPAKYSGSTPTVPSLTITGAESVDAATYVCTATNSVGAGTSTQTSLSVTGDIPTVTVPSATYSTVSGSSVTLMCVVAASPPADSVLWKKIKNTVSSDIDVSLAAFTGGTVGNPSLTIVTATSAEMADYICTATNSVGTGESGRTTLTVTGAVPTVSIAVTPVSVLTGQSVDIVCKVVSDPPASSISWSKTVGTVTSVLNIDNTKFAGGTIQTPSLTINNAASNDQASYKCTATNVVGSATSNAAVLSVTGGIPTVLIDNPGVTAVLGSSVTLICKVTANPTATGVSWERTIGGVTTPIVLNTKFVGSTVANPSLTINTLATTDQGSYVCVAENEIGTGRSAPGSLTVTGNVPSVVISKPSYTVVTGTDINIDCDYTASPAATSLKWKKIVNTQSSDVVLTGSTKYSGGTLASPALVIASAVAADQAFYQCVVTNSVGDGLSTTAYLFVTGAIPTASVTQTSYNIDLGQPVTIACNVAGVPDVQSVTWTITKPPSTTSTPIVINAPKYSGGSLSTPSLTIATAALADQGIYKCKATNILGTGESANVYLNVVGSSPTVSVPVSSYTVDRGGNVVLACSIVASPAVTTVYWTRTVQGAVNHITAASPKYEGSSPTDPSLTINTLEPGDEGSYRCHATNSVSTGRSELTNLIVSLAPTNIQVDPASVTRREQQEFSSVCTAEANPAPTYRWVKESTQQVISTMQTLTIQNIDRGHQGQYICTASNSRGSATATLNVDVQYKPISTVATAEQTIVIGMNDPRILTCNTISNPSVETYRWQKSNVDIVGATGLTHVVTVMSQSDYGTYSCYATNSIGQSSAINFLLQSGAVTPTPADDTTALTTEMIIAIAVAIAVLLLILIIICVCCCARAPTRKVERVYTKKPLQAPMAMMAPPVVMRDPSMALVPMNDSFRRQYDNSYMLNRSELPAQEYTYYESERGRKDRPSSFINFSGE